MNPPTGFGVVDQKGRVALPKDARSALGVKPGSHVAYVVLDGALILIPQDEHLAELSRRAEAALAAAGLTVDDILARLPEARAAVMEEMYPAEFLAELRRQFEEAK